MCVYIYIYIYIYIYTHTHTYTLYIYNTFNCNGTQSCTVTNETV